MNFGEFFHSLYGLQPFPWQSRLAAEVADHGWVRVPVLDLPTGVGKTAALDIAVYHLIRQALDGIERRTAPLRIFYIIDRRIVVDAAFRRARFIAAKLRRPDNDVLDQAAKALCERFDNDEPLHAAILRGGMFRDDGWIRSPAQPTICVSTVDQVGSRLLFRGYGVSPSMRPVHAALVGTDSLYLVDEAHLSQPFLETLNSVGQYGGEKWAENSVVRPVTVVRMSATTDSIESAFRLDDGDRGHDLLRQRLTASRPAVVDKPVRVDKDDPFEADGQFAQKAASVAVDLAGSLQCTPPPVVGVVVNRVRTARLVFDELNNLKRKGNLDADIILLTGRIRPYDRDELLFRLDLQNGRGWLRLMEAGREAIAKTPLFVVATQTIEVGADLDFDGLVTEGAPLDAIRQRFGRLNRLGERLHARAVILVRNVDKAANPDDPVYGNALSRTWNWLNAIAEKLGRQKVVDFGLERMAERVEALDPEALQPMLTTPSAAPVMLPAHIDLWCQTNPAPAAAPDIAVFLHGQDSRPADVNVVWRADLLTEGEIQLQAGSAAQQRYVDAVSRIPPTSQEACPVPLHAVRSWLQQAVGPADVTDLEGGKAPNEISRDPTQGRCVLRWLGPDDSEIVRPREIKAGDTIVVPCSYGGCDEFGWNPHPQSDKDSSLVTDIAEACSRWGRGRPVLRLDERVARAWCWKQQSNTEPEHEQPSVARRIKELSAAAVDSEPQDHEIEAILRLIADDIDLPFAVQQIAREFAADGDIYRIESIRSHEWEGRYWLLVGQTRLSADEILDEVGGIGGAGQEVAEGLDDESSAGDAGAFNAAGRVSLRAHTDGVREVCDTYLRALRLPDELSDDLRLAVRWHDLGKLDERFQKWLYGDEIEWSAYDELLAKSGLDCRNRSELVQARVAAGVPKGFRHEALSVQLLDHFRKGTLAEAHDADLVRFLIGTHHGYGRPFHPVVFDESPLAVTESFDGVHFELSAEERAALPPLHNLAAAWPDVFWKLTRRYGYWGLAWLEAVLRLADQQRSRDEFERATPHLATINEPKVIG